MLHRIGGNDPQNNLINNELSGLSASTDKKGAVVTEEGAVVTVAEASFPVPFVQELEFNPPVHGPWNIVHVGMLIPECHQIYVCADNCMRGVVLTAAEMGMSDRFSCVLLEEEDLYEGSLEDITVEGITDAINRISYRPRAVMVFLVCLHHFIGTDTAWVYQTLEKRFPDIDFMRCWMDPVMRKTGLAPEQKLKESMFRPVRPLPLDPKLVFVLGDNQPVDMESDLARTITGAGYRVRCLQDCRTYDDYLEIGAASLLITRSPAGIHGVTQLAKRFGRPFLYLSPSFGAGEIREELQKLEELLNSIASEGTKDNNSTVSDNSHKRSSDQDGQIWLDAEERNAEKALAWARACIGDTEITVDHVAASRPLGLARLLLEHDFHVTRVYLDAVTPEEKGDFEWLREHHPQLLLSATIHPKMRVLHAAENEGNMLAIGPKAAWFGGTAHFVNIVEFSGMWGFSGIAKLADLMVDAFLHEKDTRSIVPRKGFGCACIL